MLVIAASGGQTKIAPLFTIVCEVSPGADGGPSSIVPVTEPDLNVALFSPELLGPEVESDFAEILGDEPNFTSAELVEELLPRLGERLGIETGDFRGLLETSLPTSPGMHHVATLTLIEDSDATRDLISELDALAMRTDWTETAAASLLQDPRTVPDSRTPILIAPLQLNESQEKALTDISQNTVTAVTGPPGTGKSQVVVSAVANSWIANQSVLVASTNNAAVDVAVDRANQLSLGLLARTGNKSARDQLPTFITNVLAQRKDRPDMRERLAAATQMSNSFELRREFHHSLKALEEAEAELLILVSAAHDAALLIWSDPQVHQRCFGNSELAEKVRRLLWIPMLRKILIRQTFRRFSASTGSINIDAIKDWAKKVSSFERSRDRVIGLREQCLTDVPNHLSQLDASYTTSSTTLLDLTVSDLVASNKAHIGGLGNIGVGGRKTQDAIRYAQAGLKGWACTALSMKRNFELKANSFDLAIIDEASQCSLAYILPIAYRSRRIAVVGDPNQLPPVITLGSRTAANIARKNQITSFLQTRPGIDFVDGSAFHAFEEVHGHTKTYLLNEHFRCHPKIARWFNSVFYGDSLHVLTDVASMTASQRGLAWIDVAGVAERPNNKKSWTNRAEAQAAVDVARSLIDEGLTVGIVSPFAGQANLIQSMVESSFSRDEIADSNLVVGTAHRLQGDERDAVIFSCCITPATFTSTIKWIEEQRNLVNVAVSRAKQYLIILGHPAIDAIGSPTFTSLRAFALEHLDDSVVPRRVDSHSESVLLKAMIGRGLSPLAKIDVEGFELDFAIIAGDRKINIEVDGDHHIDASGGLCRRDVARDRVLRAAGWDVIRFPAWRCWTEPDVVATEIQSFIEVRRSI
jgi:very-short-patch-repair endonuclease